MKILSAPYPKPRLISIGNGLPLISVVSCALVALSFPGLSWGQNRDVGTKFPEKPIRIISSGSPGSGNDIVARILGRKLAESWQQTVIIENRDGAGGAISAELAAKSNPDGYTLFLGFSGNLAAIPALKSHLAYHPTKDFVPVTQVVSSPALLAAHPSLQVTSVKDLIALAKARPGQLNYASYGFGSINYVAAEQFKSMTSTNITQVQYKSSAQAVSDVISGHVQLMFHTASVLLPQVKAGRLTGLAVTSPQRVRAFPDIPTVSEAGVPGYQAEFWMGLLVPARTPRAVVEKLNREVVRIIRSEEIQRNLTDQGFLPVGSAQAEFEKFLDAEIKRYAKIIADSGMREK